MTEHRMCTLTTTDGYVPWSAPTLGDNHRMPQSDDYYLCGSCGIVLVRYRSLAGATGLVMRCINCGACNSPAQE